MEPFSWADENDSFAEVNIPSYINDISKNPNDHFYEKEKELYIAPNSFLSGEFSDSKIVDKPEKPENLNVQYIAKEEEYRQKTNVLEWKKVVSKKNTKTEKSAKTSSKSGKCYTCFPRRKVNEHVIQTTNGITFHHDMCNRSIIVASPSSHFSTLEKVENVDIGNLFKEVHLFCYNWNIVDYSVTYNQGDWQTHNHFHLKIKTHENIIKRLREDHFKCISIQKNYN